MVRYGIIWNGPKEPISTEMPDGYWTPYHLANEEVSRLKAENEQLKARLLMSFDNWWEHRGMYALGEPFYKAARIAWDAAKLSHQYEQHLSDMVPEHDPHKINNALNHMLRNSDYE